MQTFLTHPTTDFSQTAVTLDNKRLNKNALEAWQIMMTNLQLDPQGNFRQPKGWYNHPATKMWRGHEITLLRYIQAMAEEWVARGFKTTILDKARATVERALELGLIESATQPTWMQDHDHFERIAESHRKALLVKNYEWYSQFNWREDTGAPEADYEYVWGEIK